MVTRNLYHDEPDETSNGFVEARAYDRRSWRKSKRAQTWIAVVIVLLFGVFLFGGTNKVGKGPPREHQTEGD